MKFPFRGETKELNELTRQSASGSFVALSDGMTHYELRGNESADAVVLVHGFSVPYFIFDSTFEFLTQTGFRVLRYDLFGRGFSDRPDTRYNIDLFVRQLSELLDVLRISRPVNLVGLSMGGPITATYTSLHPERVKSLTLIDPSGAKSLAEGPLPSLVKLPFLTEAIVSVVGGETFVESSARDFFDPRLVDEFKAKYRVQMQFKGFLHAILSSIRNGMLESFIDIYRQVGKLDKPVLLFWGSNDRTVPIEHSDDLCAAIPNVRFRVIENCGHIPHYEKPHDVNPVLMEFLGQ
jgi:pimeloyl-ACP methyl ester carboxylesterase